MRDRSKPPRLAPKPNPAGRRATTRSGEIANSDIAARIARQVNAMTPTQVEAYIIDHGLSHLADPERLEAILKLAIGEDAAENEDGGEPHIPGFGISEAAGAEHNGHYALLPADSRRKAH